MSDEQKRVIDIAAYLEAVEYTAPCGCNRFRCGKPAFESTEYIKTCSGGVAIRKFQDGGRVNFSRGGGLCADFAYHVAADIKRLLDRHQPGRIIRREVS